MKDMLSDKQCCLSAELSFVNSCIMMAVREIWNYSSLHFTFYSMKPNEVMLISDSFTGDATKDTEAEKRRTMWWIRFLIWSG